MIGIFSNCSDMKGKLLATSILLLICVLVGCSSKNTDNDNIEKLDNVSITTTESEDSASNFNDNKQNESVADSSVISTASNTSKNDNSSNADTNNNTDSNKSKSESSRTVTDNSKADVKEVSSIVTDEEQYNKGLNALDNSEWDTAISVFGDIDYKDSKELLEKAKREKGMHENADYDFLDAISEAVMKRYEVSQKTSDLEKCLSYETEMLSGFKDKSFYDENLKNLALDYISGVEMEKESLSLDEGSQQLKLYEGKAKRFETLVKLTDNYGLLADNVDYKVNYYNQAEERTQKYNALKEIEEDLGNQLVGDNVRCEFIDDYTGRLYIVNHTSYTYDLKMHFIHYDENNNIIETFTKTYSDVEAGCGYNLDFYFPMESANVKWYTEEYIK